MEEIVYDTFQSIFVDGSIFASGTYDDQVPMAFLNYIFFDKNMVFNNDFGYQLVSASGLNEWEKLSLQWEIDEPGYLYIYVANESMADVNVYFDDMEIRLNESPLAQSADNYPFGLEIADRSFNRESYRFGYQGQFAEKDEETGWNSFEARHYNSRIGNWVSIDPSRQFFSSYLGMGNNPIISIDQDGRYTKLGAIWRAFFTSGVRVSDIYKSGKEWGFNAPDGSFEIINGAVVHGFESRFGKFGQDIERLLPYEPNTFGNIKKGINDLPVGLDYLGHTFYNIADDFYIGFLQVGKNRKNLEGFGMYSSEVTDAGINTLNTIIPVSKVTAPAIKRLNASQFSELFKGTFINKFNPQIRGFLNKQYNSLIIKKQVKYIHSGAIGGTKIINKNNLD